MVAQGSFLASLFRVCFSCQAAVHEVEHCEHLIHMLYSENLPDREKAVVELVILLTRGDFITTLP